MSTIPNKKAEQLAFFEAHFPVWLAAPTTIGLTAAQASAWKTQVQSARAAFDAAQAARNAARSATGNQDSALSAAYTGCADLIRVIRAYAEQQPNPQTVYDAAQIPAPSSGSPVGPPGTPFDFTVSLAQNGAVTLGWKCVNPEGAVGTIYEVRRKTGTGTFQFIGAIGIRKFTDDTLPAGSTNVVYQITGVRSTQRGEPGQFNVNFGIGGDGFAVATVTSTPAVKLAA